MTHRHKTVRFASGALVAPLVSASLAPPAALPPAAQEAGSANVLNGSATLDGATFTNSGSGQGND